MKISRSDQAQCGGDSGCPFRAGGAAGCPSAPKQARRSEGPAALRCNSDDHDGCPSFLARMLLRTRLDVGRHDWCQASK